MVQQGGHTTDVSDSVAMLCEQNIRPYLEPMQHTFDSDVFRRERLYRCEWVLLHASCMP